MNLSHKSFLIHSVLYPEAVRKPVLQILRCIGLYFRFEGIFCCNISDSLMFLVNPSGKLHLHF